MKGIVSVFLAAVMLLCVPSIWGQSDLESQNGQGIGQFLTHDNRVDLQAIRASGYQGSLNLDGFAVGLDPTTGEPIVRTSGNDNPKADPDDIYWEAGFGQPGTNGYVCAFAIFEGNLIVGGYFNNAVGGIFANCIASWNGTEWSPLGTGLNNGVNNGVLALNVYDNKLIAGGVFTEAGGASAERIAAWDGSSWSALGTGMDFDIIALTIYDNELIAGGYFTTAGGVSANYIAAWDGSNWSALGSGMDNWVTALAVYDNKLIAGGNFTNAGGVPVSFIASWDGSDWSGVGTGMGPGTSINVRAFTVYDNQLIAGGWFSEAGGASANNIAAWDGSSWSALGSGINGGVNMLAVYKGQLIAGGQFSEAGGSEANKIAIWNGSSWSALGSGTESVVLALAEYDNQLMVGGEFIRAGGILVNYIASWNDISWSAFDPGMGMDGLVRALTVYDGQLIAGGDFVAAGGNPVNFIAAWDGVEWSDLGGGTNGGITTLTVYDDMLIAGGGFSEAGGIPANYVAAWNGSSWSALGDGLNNLVTTSTVYDNRLIIGGGFTSAGGVSANRIAAWNGTSWSPLGPGFDSNVLALATYDGKLIAGGEFENAEGGGPLAHIAAWDGLSWSPLGTGMGGTYPNVFALTEYNNQLIAGGNFTLAGGTSANKIAAWDGATWSPLGSGVATTPGGGYISSLTIHNNLLTAGGYFYTAGGNSARSIAFWDGSGWSRLGSGVYGIINDLAVYNDKIFVGGDFSEVGDKFSVNIAVWNRPQPYNQITSLADDGAGTLRAAITAANSSVGLDTITFTLSGTVSLATSLPALIDDSTIILGSTAPGGAHSIILDGAALFGGSGMVIQSRHNKIEGLTIRNFPQNGIEIVGPLTAYNTISNNIIYSNDEIGIDLGNDGVTPNDAGDGDTGPNGLLNYPQIDSLFMNPDSSFRVYGTVADSGIIEFFVAHPEGDDTKPADPSGHGEAWSYIGSDTTDINGDFEYEIGNSVPYFSLITATCTDTLGNTSEFAPNFNLVPTPLIIVGYSPINLHIIDPAGDSIGKLSDDTYFNTIGGNATYDDIIHDSITIQYPLEGEYIIIVYPQGDPPPGAIYSVGIRIDGSVQAIIVENANVPASGGADTLGYLVEEEYHYGNGDASRDDAVNLIDILYLIAYLYNSPPGPAPYPLGAGDANCDLTINLIDILSLIAYKYNAPPGPAPCEL